MTGTAYAVIRVHSVPDALELFDATGIVGDRASTTTIAVPLKVSRGDEVLALKDESVRIVQDACVVRVQDAEIVEVTDRY